MKKPNLVFIILNEGNVDAVYSFADRSIKDQVKEALSDYDCNYTKAKDELDELAETISDEYPNASDQPFRFDNDRECFFIEQ